MTYGLSRDDAGRFMRDYVNRGVFLEDPFHSLDLEGVGELMLIAAKRGRERNPDIVLGLCGEHGGDPSSVRFCKVAGFDYVSCSPFRVPIARLAAAQATLLRAGRRGGRIAAAMKPLPGDLAGARSRAARRRSRAACRRWRAQPGRPGARRAARGGLARRRGASRSASPARRASESPPLPTLLIASFARAAQTVAVIAVDPSSRALGRRAARRPRADRRPIPATPASSSARWRRGAGSAASPTPTFPAVVLMRACFDWVLVETVGVGQSETEIADCADLVVLCVQPGVRRRAAVHEGRGHGGARPRPRHQGRSRRPGPPRRADLRGALSLAAGREPPRSRSSRRVRARGCDEVVDLIAALPRSAPAIWPTGGVERRPAPGPTRGSLESFGTVGLAALGPGLPQTGRTRSRRCATGRERARAAVHECLKNI